MSVLCRSAFQLQHPISRVISPIRNDVLLNDVQQLKNRAFDAIYIKLCLRCKVAFFQQAICTWSGLYFIHSSANTQLKHRHDNHRDHRTHKNNRGRDRSQNLMQTYIGELLALCIFSLGLTDALFAVAKFKAHLAIVFIARMLVYAGFAIIADDYCIKFPRARCGLPIQLFNRFTLVYLRS